MIIKDSSAFGDTGTVCLVEKLQRLITKHLNTAAPACSVALWEITNALKVPGGRVKGYWSYLSENLAKNVFFFFLAVQQIPKIIKRLIWPVQSTKSMLEAQLSYVVGQLAEDSKA